MIENFDQACSWLFGLHRFGIKLGLEQTVRLTELCGAFPNDLKFIHLAGTNGKGSTGAMLERALRCNGFTTGFYSSPHLVSACERIRINGKAISEEEFLTLAGKLETAVEKMRAEGSQPTYFEVVTAMAMLSFIAHKCDYVVWETGMGGRLDATNIVQPVICAITNIALDHEKFLGDNVAAIASEKAGIVKTNAPVVVGQMPLEAEEVIRLKAAMVNTEFYRAKELSPLSKDEKSLMQVNYQQFTCGGETIELKMNGLMQQRNAQLVISVLKVLKLWNDASCKALSETRWPARIETLKAGRFILDGGHNPDGLTSLTETLKVLYPGKKFDWVFGAFADKDYSGGLKIIAPLAKSLSAVAFAEEARLSASLDDICSKAKALGIENCRKVDDLEGYLNKLSREEPSDGLPTVIAGSLYLAGEVLEILTPPEHVLEL